MNPDANAAGSSSAEQQTTPPPSFDVPRDRAAYDHWRKTGETALPAPADKSEDKSKSEASTTSTKKSSETAADSETAETKQQERKPRTPKSNAETRLDELLADLKNAGLSPSELKTFKRQAQEQSDAAKPAAAEAAKPAADQKPNTHGLTPPVKPKIQDFASYDAYETANEKYIESLADFRVQLALRQERAAQHEQQVKAKQDSQIANANERYGADAGATIRSTAKQFAEAKGIPAAVQQFVSDLPHLVDVMYAIGSKEQAAELIELCQKNPSQAIQKLAVMEHLVAEELAKAPADKGEAKRDSNGKFVSDAAEESTPAKQTTSAPPPPREASGRSSAPPDESEAAVQANDFRRFREAENRKDLARAKGR